MMEKLKNIFSRSNSKVDDPDDYIPLFDGSDEDPSNEITEESWGSIVAGWIRGALLLAVSGALFIGILYSLLAAFLIMWVPVGSQADYFDRENLVRNTWSETGGVPNIGDKAVVSLNTFKSDINFLNYALYGWTRIPASAEVEVLSTDRDKIVVEAVSSEKTGENGEALREGKVTVLTGDDKPSFNNFVGSAVYDFDADDKSAKKDTLQLDGEILVKCLSGDCEPDTVFILSTEQIFGEINRR